MNAGIVRWDTHLSCTVCSRAKIDGRFGSTPPIRSSGPPVADSCPSRYSDQPPQPGPGVGPATSDETSRPASCCQELTENMTADWMVLTSTGISRWGRALPPPPAPARGRPLARCRTGRSERGPTAWRSAVLCRRARGSEQTPDIRCHWRSPGARIALQQCHYRQRLVPTTIGWETARSSPLDSSFSAGLRAKNSARVLEQRYPAATCTPRVSPPGKAIRAPPPPSWKPPVAGPSDHTHVTSAGRSISRSSTVFRLLLGGRSRRPSGPTPRVKETPVESYHGRVRWPWPYRMFHLCCCP